MSFLNIEQIDNFGKTLSSYKDINHTDTARIVCVSDTHNRHQELDIPEGDVLIHAGDITTKGTIPELQDFNGWLDTLPHKHKIVIGGNHDEILDNSSMNKKEILSNCMYLEYSSVEIYGWKLYGFPSSVKIFGTHRKGTYIPGFVYSFLDYLKPYKAFQLDVGSQAHLDALSSIPSDTDILITHGPPYGAGDLTSSGEMHGDKELRNHVEQRIRPNFHIFGHIHEAYGVSTNGTTIFINAASPTRFPWMKRDLNTPIVFDIDVKT